MKKILSLTLCLVQCALCTAQPVCTPNNTVCNMGDIMYRTPHTATFTIHNSGNKPLVIEAVRTSCGCTTVDYPTKPIAVKKSATITATYDAAMMGTFVKEIEVITNASREPLYLTLQGRVTNNPASDFNAFPIDLDNVRMSTNSVEFDNVNKGDMPVAEIGLINTTRMAYQPQLMHLPNFLTATYEPTIIPGGRTGKIRLTLDSDKVPAMGLTQRSIYLARYMGDKVASDNEVAVSIVLLPDFTGMESAAEGVAPTMALSATELDLGEFEKKSKLSGIFTITNKGRTTLTISRLQVFNRAIGVNLGDSSIPAGETVKLKVTVTKEELANDKNPLRILLITNDPSQPKQTLTLKVK